MVGLTSIFLNVVLWYGHIVFFEVLKSCFPVWVSTMLKIHAKSQVWLPWHHQGFQVQHLWRPWVRDWISSQTLLLWHFKKNNAGFELRVWLNARLEAMSRFLVQTLYTWDEFFMSIFARNPWSFWIWDCLFPPEMMVEMNVVWWNQHLKKCGRELKDSL